MGQYHKPACIDLNESLHPHRFGDGLKLMEFGCSSHGTMTALALLLAGEGRWAGKQIVVVGDYAEAGDVEGIDVSHLYMSRDDHDEYATEYPEYYPLAREAYSEDVSGLAGQMLVDEGIWSGPPEGDGWKRAKPNSAYEATGVELMVVNLDKKEALDPAAFGDGRLLGEFGLGGWGSTMTALAVLLACSNGRGGGDFHGDGAGRWAADRIGIVPFGGGEFTDIGPMYRALLEDAREGTYRQHEDGTIERLGWDGESLRPDLVL